MLIRCPTTRHARDVVTQKKRELVEQRLRLDENDGVPLLQAIHSVTLFGTPLNGSPLSMIGSALLYAFVNGLLSWQERGRRPKRFSRLWRNLRSDD